ncbi:MAG: hypothetical protein M1833_001603 [Piccolia ochrophora]|nr:MAG: hypothetical protein M1833_001603 [Piccolia ochrophora]
MFAADAFPDAVSQFQTRQALLVLDLQNDFVSINSQLPVSSPPTFIPNIKRLVPFFRTAGDVTFVRTEFQGLRTINDEKGEGENVVTDVEVQERRNKVSDVSSATQQADVEPLNLRAENTPRRSASVASSQRARELYRRIAERNALEDDRSDYDSQSLNELEDNETFLSPSASGRHPTCCIPGTLGAAFADLGSPVMDEEKDTVVVKSYYSAFHSTSLLSTLRSSLVTELFICGIISNVSVYATALDAARHGFSITLVEDAIGYRDKDRHDEAVRQMTEYMGADSIKTEELVDIIQKTSDNEPRGRSDEIVGSATGEAEIERYVEEVTLSGEPLGKSTTDPRSFLVPLRSDADSAISMSHRSESYSTPSGVQSRAEPKFQELRQDLACKSPTKNGAISRAGLPGASMVDRGTQRSPHRARPNVERQRTAEVLDSVSATLADASTDPVDSLAQFMSSMALKKSTQSAARTSRHPRMTRLRRGHEKVPPPIKSGNKEVIGEGDSQIVGDLLPAPFKDDIFAKVRTEVRWKTMYHRGGEVPRLVAVQGNIADDGSFPIYRHPADESPPLLPFSPIVCAIRDEVQKVIHHPVNHVLIQYYRDGQDYISEHSDKTLDVVRGSSIVNVSLGAQRTMTLRTKRLPRSNSSASRASVEHPSGICTDSSRLNGSDRSKGSEISTSRRTQRILMPHNSMFVLGQTSNMRWLHGIRQDKRPASEKSEEEVAYGGERISLTFRHIGTFLDRDSKKIWGQGAKSKRKTTAGSVINGDTPDARTMIEAFGRENQQSEFDWDNVYGPGFDVLDIVTDTPHLFLSGHEITDLRVKLHLSMAGIAWGLGRHVSDEGRSDEDQDAFVSRLKFADNDVNRTEVVGPLPVLLYVDNFYRCNGNFGASHSRPEFANVMTRFGQSNDFMRAWEAVANTSTSASDGGALHDRLLAKLHVWDAYAKQSSFIASDSFSVADSAFWPVLRDVIGKWSGWDAQACSALWTYHLRMLQRPAVKRVLVGEED